MAGGIVQSRCPGEFSCGTMLVSYPGQVKLAAVTTTPETIPAY
jgi:hypothetical protein